MQLPVDKRTLADLAAHPALLPLIAETDVTVVPGLSSVGVRCPEPGRVQIRPDLEPDHRGRIALRYGLELAWLAGLPGLGVRAAAVLAARTAGRFAGLPGVLAEGEQPDPVLAGLVGHVPDQANLAIAARSLADTHDGGDVLSQHDLACIEALWPLAVPTECLLASGGDERLLIDAETGLNRYGCTPWPRPSVVTFASCTASSLSPGAFAAAEQARHALAAATLETAPSVALAEASDTIGAALLAYFQVADMAEAVLAASGTDAALVVTGLLAAERPGETLTSILMSPSETGSGVPDAVQGRHFASSAAAGCKVGKGQPIEGLASGPHLVTVPLREASGAPRGEDDIAAACDRAIRSGAARGRVVLHAIDGSKTGLTAPDRAACRQLADRYGDRLDIVVDACQARIEPALVQWYLRQGFPVLVTGSKFFAAPGFCGAVLFPRERLQRIARHGRLPAGLAPYARLEGGFGSRRCPGLVLRWRAALHEMQAFAGLPAGEVRHRLSVLEQAVTGTLSRDRRLLLVEAPRPEGFGWSDQRSVFSFAIRSPAGWLDTVQLRRLYDALNTDLSRDAPPGLRLAASQLCQIGQPVELGSSARGGLRIAVSAAQIVEGGDQQAGLTAVIDKLGLLLDREHAGAAPAQTVPLEPDRPSLPRALTG